MATLRKKLGKTGLLSCIREPFSLIPNPVQGRLYFLVDYLMSGLAVFSLQFPSLLKFDTAARHNKKTQISLKNLFGVKQAPSDSAIRKVLDLVNPEYLGSIFNKIFAILLNNKVLNKYRYINGAYLMALDGTQYFSSKKVRCRFCGTKKPKNGKTTFLHQLLAAVIIHPDHKAVFPLALELIKKTDGANKNDCELAAIRRLLTDFRREHPHLKIIIILDSLYSNAPLIKLLADLNIHFIIAANDGNHEELCLQIETHPEVKDDNNHDDPKHRYGFRFLKQVPLNKTKDAPLVNLLEYWEMDEKGHISLFTWVTDLPIDRPAERIKIMRAGRARWKIENETFNTLKNQGYNLEHNFGHGHQHLSSVFVMLMMLAFLIDQIELSTCKVFRAALAAEEKISYLREYIRTICIKGKVPNWYSLYRAIALDKVEIKIPNFEPS